MVGFDRTNGTKGTWSLSHRVEFCGARRSQGSDLDLVMKDGRCKAATGRRLPLQDAATAVGLIAP